MIGSSKPMQKVYRSIRRVSRLDIPVLITGESGSGKELVAHAIHNESPRRSGPFHAVNTGALTPDLIASELFGHEKGAFTGATASKKGVFEIADGGTLFLDEIGTMGLDNQVDLLRVIEFQTFTRVGGTTPIRSNVRILAAANADLREMVREQRFRADLYYRLSVFPLPLPPLRKRRTDIPILAEFFRQQYASRYNHEVRGFDERAIRQLRSYGWPGNVRELSNVVLRLVVSATDPMITEVDVAEALYQTAVLVDDEPASTDHEIPLPTAPSETARESAPEAARVMAGRTIEEVERELIEATLRRTGGNRTKAARLLGISRKSLYNKVKSYEIDE